MKKMIFMALVLLVAAGCSKSDDYDIDKTYADDDFLITERNIKEKLVGEWEIQKMKCEIEPYVWWILEDDELGDEKYLKFRSDGSCEFLGLNKAHWYVKNTRVYITYAEDGSNDQKAFEDYIVLKMERDFFALSENANISVCRYIEMKRR